MTDDIDGIAAAATSLELMDWPTLIQRWDWAVGAAPDQTFLELTSIGADAVSWSYSQFDEIVEQVRGSLTAVHGLRAGDRIQLVLSNCPAFVAVLLAAARSGWMILPCDPRSTSDEMARQAARVEPAVAICGLDQSDAYYASGATTPVVTVDPTDSEMTTLRTHGGGGAHPEVVSSHTVLGLMFTSGTTSEPKIVEVTQANYAFAGDVMAAAAGLRPGSRFLVVLPLFHANAQYYSIAASISVGATVILVGGFSASRFLEQAEQTRATHASLFAAPIRMILARARPTNLPQPLENVWFSQNLTNDEYERFATLVGCRPRQIYGMTETAPAVLMSRRLNRSQSTLGTPTLGCHVRLRNPHSDTPVKPGDTGRIQVGGYRGLSLFSAYRDNPQATAEAFVDHDEAGLTWMDTGDLGRVNACGEVEFVGRSGDMLKVGGENVSVLEVEAFLLEHPHVVDAAVVGVPDPVRDEVPLAFVVPAADAPNNVAEAVMAWCATRLSGPRRPREIRIVDQLPRTAVGKIQRFRLIDRPGSPTKPV